MGRRKGLTPALTALGLAAAATAGTLAEPAALQPRMEPPEVQQLKEELLRTKSELLRAQTELHQLRGALDGPALDEQRAAEVRAIVEDVLADADLRASLLQNGITGGYDNGFFLGSADGNFRLNVGGYIQTRFIYNYRDAPDRHRRGFEIARTRLDFRGHVVSPNIEYRILGEFSNADEGNMKLLDSWVRFRLDESWALRVGQFPLPFSREFLVSPTRQLAVDRSIVNGSLNIGRSQGAELTYVSRDFRISGALSDGATDNIGGFGLVSPGGSPTNSPALDEDVEFALTSRVDWKLAGGWSQFSEFTSRPAEPFAAMLGAAVHYEKGEYGTFSDSNEWFLWTVDASLKFGGANLYGAFIHGNLDTGSFDVDTYGFVVQGGWYFNENIELFGRYEWGQLTTDFAGVNFKALSVATVGVNYYFHDHRAKFTTDIGFGFREVDAPFAVESVGYRQDPEGADPQIVFRMQLQLQF